MYNEGKKRALNDVIRKPDKTGSTDRTSASGCPCCSRTRENTKAVFTVDELN